MLSSRTRGLGATALLAVALVLAGATPASAAEDGTIATLVNEARWSNGMNGLLRSGELDAVAANWARHMAETGQLEHNPNLSGELPPGWSAAAENIATGHPNGRTVHDGWMASSGHRANILGDFTDIGIAFLSAGGTTWSVEVFAKYPGHAGPPPPQPAAGDPDPQPSIIDDPSIKPTIAPLPSASASPSPSASPSGTPSPTTTEGEGSGSPPGDTTGVTWLIVLAALAAVAAVLGLLALSRRGKAQAEPVVPDESPGVESDPGR